jgi:hypothetical protein
MNNMTTDSAKRPNTPKEHPIPTEKTTSRVAENKPKAKEANRSPTKGSSQRVDKAKCATEKKLVDEKKDDKAAKEEEDPQELWRQNYPARLKRTIEKFFAKFPISVSQAFPHLLYTFGLTSRRGCYCSRHPSFRGLPV